MIITKPTFIACAGAATSGKNYFCNLLSEKIGKENVQEISFADHLKSCLSGFLYENFGIRIFYCTPFEKELIRGILVEFAKAKRKINPDYFIQELAHKLEKHKLKNIIYCCVDCRYENEYNYIKSLGGLSVYISKYIKDENGWITYIAPANLEEEKNNTFLFKNADYYIDWEHNNPAENDIWINKFIDFLEDKI